MIFCYSKRRNTRSLARRSRNQIIPLIVGLAIGSLEEVRGPRRWFSFFLVLFLSLRLPVEMWEIPEAVNRRAGLRMNSPTTRWLRGDFRIRPELEAKRMLRCCPSRTRL